MSLTPAADEPFSGASVDDPGADVRTVWEVAVGDHEGRTSRRLYELAIRDGLVASCRPYEGDWPPDIAPGARPAQRDRATLVEQALPNALRSALTERGELPAGSSYSSRLLGWVEVA